MLERLSPIELGNRLKLNIIKSDKFKTNLVGLYIQRPLIKEEVTKNALLSMILSKSTMKYPTFFELSRKLEELYGSVLVSNVVKKGEKQIIQIKMQFPNSKYIDNDNIMKESIEILNGIINEQVVEDNGFASKIFNQQKKNLKEKIKGRINDKMKYALDRCVEKMCENENYSLFEYGSIDEIDKIDEKGLYEHFKNIIKGSPIDIFVIGDVDKDKVVELIKNNLVIKRDKIVDIPRESIHKSIEEVKFFEDNLNVNQGKLTLGYRTNVPYESDLYESSILFSNILGGGPNSKLFKNVREKESLCYYIFSRVEKFKSLMLVSSGIEFQNFEKTKNLIIENVESMKKGDFTEDDIEIAKKSIITSIRSLSDAPNMLMDFYFAQVLSDVPEDIEGIIEKINRVTKDSIIEAGKKFELDSIYFLNHKGEGK